MAHAEMLQIIDSGSDVLHVVAYQDREFRIAVNRNPHNDGTAEYVLLDRWHAVALREFLDHHLKDES